MQLFSILIIIILNGLLWNLIDSVKNNKEKNELTRVKETSKDLSINDDAEPSINSQIRGYEKNDKEKKRERNRNYYSKNKEKMREYIRNYYQKSKEKIRESARNYYKNNKEKRLEWDRKYRLNNKEKRRETNRNYYQNNKEKERERNRKYREKMKNKKENLKNVDPQVGNVHSDNNEGSSFVRNDFRDKGKLPIVYEEGIQHEEGNLLNQEEEECSEKETNLDEQNQSVVEEANMNQINLNVYPFDLNKKPEGEDEDFY